GKLQEAGLIHYSRGHITIQHREGLEERVCECYKVVKQEFDRLLPFDCPLNQARYRMFSHPAGIATRPGL
ncbi:MAG: hypothetical protein ACXWUD_00340, partial [Methylosarcina sp.]